MFCISLAGERAQSMSLRYLACVAILYSPIMDADKAVVLSYNYRLIREGQEWHTTKSSLCAPWICCRVLPKVLVVASKAWYDASALIQFFVLDFRLSDGIYS